jgi:hypothetical protein
MITWSLLKIVQRECNSEFQTIVTTFSRERKFLYMPKLTVVNLRLKFASGQFDGSACEDQCEDGKGSVLWEISR